MIIALLFAWIGGLLLIAGALVVSAAALPLRQPALALVALLPAGVAGALIAFDAELPAPDPVYETLLGIGFVLLGVIAGGPLASFVLQLATRGSSRPGVHGGILVSETLDSPTREVMRGGSTIGYLERTALIGGILLGRFEIIAVVVAIKGLGRYSELDRAESRERFIIGTLTSFVWAGICALLVVF